MQDIRKPYIRSSSNRDLRSRVEQFESRSYDDDYENKHQNHIDHDDRPVQIPQKRVRRNVNDMDMYPRRRKEDFYEDDDIERHDRRESDGIHKNHSLRRMNGENSVGTIVFIIVVILFAVGAWLLTYVFNSATVTIVPKYKDVDINKTISFLQNSQDTTNVPFIIASSSIVKTKTLSLSESKKVEAKASGKVIIYNNYDSSVQKLIKNTRLESASGKIYRINQSVSVPGKNGDTPGSVEVTVYADSNGTSYNTDPTDFTIPGFKDTPREKTFYARSKGPITGGSSGNVSLASLSDINAAKDELALELDQEIKNNLMKIQKDGYIGLYGASEITYDDNEDEILSGKTGIYSVTATGYVILADATKLAQQIALGTRDYSSEPVRLGYTETVTYTRKNTDHIATSTTLSILVAGKPRIIWVSDVDSIKDMVRGKKRSEFKTLMKSLSTVQTAEIGFSPLWLSSFPTDTGKISVVENLPKR